MSLSRQRLSAQESRAVALEAARTLLLEQGPHAVTLKAVAARVNRSHANLLHHFGSATGLQQALANYLATTICDEMAESKRLMLASDFDPRTMVDFIFDTFGSGGAGALAAWMLCTGHKRALDPIIEAVHDFIDECLPADMASAGVTKRRELTYSLVLMALGEALMGEELAGSLAVGHGAAQRHGEELLAVARERLAHSYTPEPNGSQAGTRSSGIPSTRR
ncbi:TetR/AcrR family transcriptional regulator [Aurantiacibacter flavus]|uniref:Helix-turn-helix domain-containing protein n=1 Tax=Aurantiacibacter flavus TaxID=3145232 RepID=A0ABV0CVN3_9SPHN